VPIDVDALLAPARNRPPHETDQTTQSQARGYHSVRLQILASTPEEKFTR
jgi:hypothetical protein